MLSNRLVTTFLAVVALSLSGCAKWFQKPELRNLTSSPVGADNSQPVLDSSKPLADATPSPDPKKAARILLPPAGSIPMGEPGNQPPGYPISTGLFALGGEAYFSDGSSVCHLTPALFASATGMSDTSTLRSVSEIPSSMLNEGDCPVPKGFFKFNNVAYNSDGSMSYCRYLNDAHLLSANGLSALPSGIIAVDELPAGMNDGGVCGFAKGPFTLGGNRYYSNGADAYCRFANLDHYSWVIGNVAPTAVSELPNMRDDGLCRLGEGVFLAGQTVYYSNGVNAFCGFNSPAHLLAITNLTPAQVTHVLSAVPENMRNDGACRYAQGLFVNAGTVYYSNGVDAFCGFNSEQQLLWSTGRANTSGIPVYPSLPSNTMRNDGECKYAQGGFVANGVGYVSNGVDAYCAANSEAHYLWITNQNVAQARVLPKTPTNMRNDGVCRYGQGNFVAGAGAYYSNGVDAYCAYNSPGHLQLNTGLTSTASLRVLPNVPGNMRYDGACNYAAGLFAFNGGIYYANGSTAYCVYNSAAHFTWGTGRANANGIPAVAGLPPNVRNDGECGYPAGLFMVGAGAYYSSGTAVCGYSSMDLFTVLTGRTNTNGLPALPKLSDHERNDGVCNAGKYAQGLFKVGQGIYYSNGNDAFCVFNGPDHYRWSTGRTETNGVPSVASLPNAMNNVGQCGYGAGLFQVGAAIMYSNGTAFCTYNSWDHYVWGTGRTNTNGIFNVPNTGNLQNQGTCGYPAGLFRVGGSVFYSNGQKGFCAYNSMAHYTMATGRGELNGVPSLPNVEPGSASGGTCKLGAGLYQINGAVFYSNGNDYCVFNSMAHYTWNTGRGELNGVPSLPGQSNQMNNQGICNYAQGLFNVNGGIWYSNGVNAYCAYTSWERFVAGTGLNSIAGIRQLPAAFPNGMANNGACN